jgi:type I site-specific restriction endonuclease
VPRWKASYLRHTGPTLLRPLSFRRLLGFGTRLQLDDFLKEHEVYDFAVEDFKQDCETLRQLRTREA